MNCVIEIRPDFNGPTLLELEPILDTMKGDVEVRWEGSGAELVSLKKNPKYKFVLIVPDLGSMERAANLTGKKIEIASELLNTLKITLASRKGYNWRFMVEDVGAGVARGAVTKLSADSIRRGKHPTLAKVAVDLLCNGISSQDSDVLLRLRAMMKS